MGPREQAGFLREAFDILKTTVQKWLDDKASRLAAALSFYTILSLAPLLLLIVAIVGSSSRGGIWGEKNFSSPSRLRD